VSTWAEVTCPPAALNVEAGSTDPWCRRCACPRWAHNRYGVCLFCHPDLAGRQPAAADPSAPSSADPAISTR
jgi:hypothetical protein